MSRSMMFVRILTKYEITPMIEQQPSGLSNRVLRNSKAARLRIFALCLGATSAAFNSHAALAQLTPIQVQNVSTLKPPPGARVALVEFDDLECPSCAHFNPVFEQAASKYGIPWVRHDLLIPGHVWSRQAAINARFFDSKDPKLGSDYRDYIFANQVSIETPSELNERTQKFAASHGIALPFAIDPMGKFGAQVQADNELGLRTGVSSTPTVFVVAANSRGPAFTQVINPDRDLYRLIDQALADTRGAQTAPHAR
jgi:protein-disulfide isomerase